MNKEYKINLSQFLQIVDDQGIECLDLLMSDLKEGILLKLKCRKIGGDCPQEITDLIDIEMLPEIIWKNDNIQGLTGVEIQIKKKTQADNAIAEVNELQQLYDHLGNLSRKQVESADRYKKALKRIIETSKEALNEA